MNPENVIKSNIAKTIVKMMLEEAGHTVISFRDDYLLDRLIEARVNKTKITKSLLCLPSFVVVTGSKDPVFVNVKFRGKKGSGRNIDWGSKQIHEFWSNGILITVTNEDPFFYLVEKGESISLSKVFRINKKLNKKYAQLVRKFL